MTLSIFIVEGVFVGFWYYRDYVRSKFKNRRFLIQLYYLFCERENCWIGINAKIDSHPILPHGLSGIYISDKAQIGKNVTIFHQVTIGSNNIQGSIREGAPKIGDDCYIGCGAKIIGKVEIGNNCKIGANTCVVNDIPNNKTVVSASNRVF